MMLEGKYESKSNGRMAFVDFWSMVYLGMVYSFTLIFGQINLIVFAIYFVCAMPFFYHIDKFVCICFLISTMSYFFLGGVEGVWSLYTILAMMILLRMLVKGKLTVSLRLCIYFGWMMLAIVLSYKHSEFGYTKGMFAMLYNIVIAMLIAINVKIEKDTVFLFLPKLAAFQLLAYIGFLLVNGYYDGYGFSVSSKVNHNTFGSSVAILGVIILIKIEYFDGKSALYKFFFGIACVLIIASGSRNALMAMVLTCIIIYIISQKHKGKTVSGVLTFLMYACFVVVFAVLIFPSLGIDLGRYNYVKLIESGGTNRSAIWETLAPIIWREHKWFGYGPGHLCSQKMINIFIGKDYTHTHNTIFEAWGELGICGLVSFLLILLHAFKMGYHYIKDENYYLMIGFILIDFIILSFGESFFAKIGLWIIIGVLMSGKNHMMSQKILYTRSVTYVKANNQTEFPGIL